MAIPPVGFDGQRRTVNYGISQAQTVWNLRSALNVAALNCLDPQYQPVLDAYKLILKKDERALRKTNDALLQEYREKYGSRYRDQFDTYMTQVYNFYAMPPARKNFCDAALAVSTEAMTMDVADLEAFSLRNLPILNSVFENFFNAYEAYRTNLAAWDAEYGPQPATSTLVATYGSTHAVAAPATGVMVNTDGGAPTVPTPGTAIAEPAITLPPSTTMAGAPAAPSITLPSPSGAPVQGPSITLPPTDGPTGSSGGEG